MSHFLAGDNPDRLNHLRIAYFSPLPPQRSGIADYSRELLPYLAQQVELVLYAADPQQVSAEMRRQYVIRDLEQFPRERWQFDLALYQMGNSEYHASFYPLLLQYPGVVVLHDYAIHHFQAHRTLDQEDYSGYAREMGYAKGAQGLQRAIASRLGQAPPAVFELPLNDRLLDISLGLIVHSAYVAGKVRAHGFDRPLAIIPALIEEHPARSRRAELELEPEAILFASFGVITAQKRIDLVLRAFQQLRVTFPSAHYLLVGDDLAEFDLEALIAELDLTRAVTRLGYTADFNQFADWIATADVVINLREPTVGETSATALRAMAAGRPLIVYDTGWYSEIPAEAAFKIPPIDESQLLEAMQRLAQSPQLREQMGGAGRRYTREVCHPHAVATAYVQALSSTIASCLESNE